MASPLTLRIHANAVAVATDEASPLQGALLLGASGAGKSDLSLRLIEECPWRRTVLISDDYVDLSLEGDEIYASAPETIRGLMEVRGVGVTLFAHVARAPLSLAVSLEAPTARLPDKEKWREEGLEGKPSLPLLRLSAFEASTCAKIRIALRSHPGQTRLTER